MNLKITTDAKKTIKSINDDGFTLFGYEERDLLNQEFENFFFKGT
jgi:Fe-S cluster biosynthesis and repair protein YggX